ncbi:Acyl-CoA dehydrogenase family member 11 [Hondaea fermentalgiana]|uniref:Acyl-CoA dehydrogenase family member 11 n=1 Tax=Hondaea fermentalgiana TaxID=2315210 RepID=A0A2R5G2Q1_9STRA|nr:Acyl-CoA dehydrogenase family member 11 [Hondaea fermentalgiana]|eukprot:GBG24599.1 Acyl-CoA dehydrogenase family member 11 [Hondaea fermentalgiana]
MATAPKGRLGRQAGENSDFKFAVPKHVEELRNKVLEFVETKVYALERELENSGKHGGGMGMGGLKDSSTEGARALKKLQDEAKRQGLWALGHPKQIGGGNMPFMDYIYVNEVQGRSELAQSALGTHSLQDSLMLYRHGSEDLKAKYLNRLVQAEIYPSFAMTEPDVPSSDPTQLQTYAKLEGDEWVINGRKWWTSNAMNAEYTSVFVRTEMGDDVPPHAAFSIILVPTSTPGYNIQRTVHVLGALGGDHSEVVYDNVRVPAGNIIGKRGQGFLIAQERLGPGRIFHCMRWIGQSQRAFDLMCERLVERKVRGGGQLADVQLMQEHVFDSYCDIQALRLLTLAAAEKMDSGDYARVELAAAKAWGARALCRIMDRAVQVFGAKGLTEDTPLSAMYRMARAARFYDGPDETHISSVGRLIVREYKAGRRYDFSASKAVSKPSYVKKDYK